MSVGEFSDPTVGEESASVEKFVTVREFSSVENYKRQIFCAHPSDFVEATKCEIFTLDFI